MAPIPICIASGLQLVGFKPMSALRMHHNLRSSYFVYPDEVSSLCVGIVSLTVIGCLVGFFCVSIV